MNIRRFVATDMREALHAIRTDLGADAVMLSSRKLPEGVEVIAAIDYDDSLLSRSEGDNEIAGIESYAQVAATRAPAPLGEVAAGAAHEPAASAEITVAICG